MELKIYSVRDSKGEVYNIPMYMRSHGDAERFVETMLKKNPDEMPGWYSNMARFPEDFDLYWLGTYEDSTGKITVHDAPQHIIKAVELKNRQ